MNMKIELENCQKSLTLKDFEEVESKLGHVLPERLKEFYLQYNGGEPKQQTISINKYYEVEIRIFQPFKYNIILSIMRRQVYKKVIEIAPDLKRQIAMEMGYFLI